MTHRENPALPRLVMNDASTFDTQTMEYVENDC
jgi:hypothetical protein